MCKPRNWTSTNTTCVCSADASETASSGGATMTSGSAAMLASFGSAFDGASMGLALFSQNPILMITFATILTVCIINIIGGKQRDARDNAAGWTTVEAAKTRR